MELCSERASQFMLTRSAPLMPSRQILSMTLVPDPPIPITLTEKGAAAEPEAAESRLNGIMSSVG